jgi:hypothetical protein
MKYLLLICLAASGLWASTITSVGFSLDETVYSGGNEASFNDIFAVGLVVPFTTQPEMLLGFDGPYEAVIESPQVAVIQEPYTYPPGITVAPPFVDPVVPPVADTPEPWTLGLIGFGLLIIGLNKLVWG